MVFFFLVFFFEVVQILFQNFKDGKSVVPSQGWDLQTDSDSESESLR